MDELAEDRPGGRAGNCPMRRWRCCWCWMPPPARMPSHQARSFQEAAGITGIVLTKLDGTAKGGAVIGIREELGVPVKFIGVGEGIDDLRPFVPAEFAAALFEGQDL